MDYGLSLFLIEDRIVAAARRDGMLFTNEEIQ